MNGNSIEFIAWKSNDMHMHMHMQISIFQHELSSGLGKPLGMSK